MELDPASLDLSTRYKIQIGAIVPRPIAWVSTVAADGRANLAPFSFFAGVASEPWSLLFCPSNKPDGTEKDTLRNIDATGQFVVNIVSEPHVRRMAVTAETLPYGESEWEFAGLRQAPSRMVKPARVAGAPACFECEPIQIVRLAPGTPNGGNVVIGRILWAHVADGVIDPASKRVDPAALRAVGRMAGLTYCSTRQRVEIPWGEKSRGDQRPLLFGE